MKINNMRLFFVIGVLSLGSVLQTTAQEIINPSTAPKIIQNNNPKFSVTYAPDYVGCDIPRRFFIELKTPSNVSPEVVIDDKIKLLDINRDVVTFVNGEPTKTDLQRFYFQTLSNTAGTTEIRFKNGNQEIIVPVVIWSYDDLSKRRMVNGVPIPFRYPLYKEPLQFIKTRQTLTHDKQPPATPRIDKNKRAQLPTDETLWDLLLDVGATPRMHHYFVNIVGSGNAVAKKITPPGGLTREEMSTLPKHNAVFTSVSTFDPKYSTHWSFVVPDKNMSIPDNDFKNNDFHTGKYIDDGFNGLVLDGYPIYTMGMVNASRKSHLEGLILPYAIEYQRTGDKLFAHKSLLGLTRMAIAYNYLSTMQHFRPYRHTWDSCGLRQRLSDKNITRAANTGIVDAIGIWESRGPIPRMAEAYDIIFPTLKDDEEILPFLQAKGLPIKTHEELQKLIEHGIFLSFLQHASVGQDVNNYPGTQSTVASVVRVLDYPTTDLVDLLYVGDQSSYNREFNDSFVNTFFYKGYFRDGMKYENPGCYNINSLQPMEVLDKVNSYLSEHSEIFPKDKYKPSDSIKKLELALKNNIQCSSTPWTFIAVGDADSPMTVGNFKLDPKKRNFFGDERKADRFIKYYPNFLTPEIAWALINATNVNLPKNYPFTKEQLKEQAAKLPANWREGAFALSGSGISILRSGTGDNELALYMPYQDLSHGESISLNLHLDGFGGKLISHWGYAPYDSYGEPWYHSWATRNRGVIFNGSNDYKKVALIGTNELLFSTPKLMVSRNSSKPYLNNDQYNQNNRHLRTNLLVKTSDDKNYAVDLYQMYGGIRHLRSMNPANGECVTDGINLTSRPGTFAGANVKYGDESWARKYTNAPASTSKKSLLETTALTQLFDVSEGKLDKNTWTASWNIIPQDGSSVDLALKIHSLSSGEGKVSLCSAKDPNGHTKAFRRQLIWDHQSTDNKPIASQVINVIEPIANKANVIKSTKSLVVTTSVNEELPPVGFMVELANGDTDYCILSNNSESNKKMTLPNGKMMELTGRIGFITIDSKDEISSMNLAEGTLLALDQKRLTQDKAMLTGTIKAVDHNNWTIDLENLNADVATLNGKTLYIEKEPELRIPLKISNAQAVDGIIRVTVDADPVMQPEFKVEKSSAKGWVTGKVLRGWGRNINGVALQSKSGKFYRVKYIDDKKNLIFANDVDLTKIEEEFPAGHTALMLDYAPDFQVTIPMSINK